MTLPSFRFATRFTIAALCLAATSITASAQVILDTDFTAAEGFNAGNLQFQQGFLGQPFAQVDPTGSGTVIGPSEPSPGAFPFGRNLFNQGATGGSAGNAGTLSSTPFAAGDQIRIGVVYQFDLIEDLTNPSGTFNTELANIGIREGFGFTEGQAFGFEAAPQQGFDAMFNIFGTGIGAEANQGGTFQAFPSFLETRSTATGIFIPGRDIGLNPNGNAIDESGVLIPGGVDLESDPLSFSYLAESDGAGNFSIQEFSVENLNTSQVFSFDLVANPISFQYLATVDSSAAPSGNGVTIGTPTPDAFLALQPAPNSIPGFELNIDSLLFEFIPINGPATPPGDYNGDGVTDAADYVLARDALGALGAGLAADGTGDDLLGVPDGDVDAFDVFFTLENFGAGAPSIVAPASVAIPEPASIVMIGLAGLAAASRRRK